MHSTQLEWLVLLHKASVWAFVFRQPNQANLGRWDAALGRQVKKRMEAGNSGLFRQESARACRGWVAFATSHPVNQRQLHTATAHIAPPHPFGD